MLSKIYSFILKAVRPFVIFTGRLYSPWSRKKVTGKHYYTYRDSIEVGTVILSKTEGEFSNLINPVSKDIKHGCIYIGYVKGIPTVCEAVSKGVVFTDLVTFLTTKDRVIGLKPSFLDSEDKVHLPLEAEKLLGLAYDYDFSFTNNSKYCFELIAEILKSTKPSIILNREEIVKGFFIYDESTFLKDDRFIQVFDSKEALK